MPLEQKAEDLKKEIYDLGAVFNKLNELYK